MQPEGFALSVIYMTICLLGKSYGYVLAARSSRNSRNGLTPLRSWLQTGRSRDRERQTTVRLPGTFRHCPTHRQAAPQLLELEVSRLEDANLDKRETIP